MSVVSVVVIEMVEDRFVQVVVSWGESWCEGCSRLGSGTAILCSMSKLGSS